MLNKSPNAMLITRRVQLLYQELATTPDHVFNNADFGFGDLLCDLRLLMATYP
jgi:hypothetical protein